MKNLDQMNLTDEEKLSLTLEVLKVSRNTLEAGHDVNDLITHGIDLISILLPKTSNCEELRCDKKKKIPGYNLLIYNYWHTPLC